MPGQDLQWWRSAHARIVAVDDVSLEIRRGQTLALVGETGCGKSTIARCIVGLERPTAGRVLVRGRDVQEIVAKSRRKLSRHVQLVFQDPYTSLNPQMTVGRLVTEPLKIHRITADRTDLNHAAGRLLAHVGLGIEFARRYPSELSGGQRQRVSIARSLALQPDLIVLDEAVAALDVSVQAQVVGLLQDLQQEFNVSYLFISHDLSVVRHLADAIAVMYLGRLVETATVHELFRAPAHPYTQSLLRAIPLPDPSRSFQGAYGLPGEVPDGHEPLSGCVYRDRCELAESNCARTVPKLEEVNGGHQAACLRTEDALDSWRTAPPW